MNKEAILKTAITVWSDEDESFVTQSPLVNHVIAIGDTEEEALELFDDMVTEHIKAYKEGRVGKPVMGRPSKGKVRIDIEIAPDIREQFRALAGEIGISQGETMEYLFSFWKAKAKHA